jgi:hypothetical protein
LIVAKFLSENAKIAFSTLKIAFPWAKNGFPGELSAQLQFSICSFAALLMVIV